MSCSTEADRKKAGLYLRKLEAARTANAVNPLEGKEEQPARIDRAKQDAAFTVKTCLPRCATAECAEFRIESANRVAAGPLFKGFAEWGRGPAESCRCSIIIPLWLRMRGEDIFFLPEIRQ